MDQSLCIHLLFQLPQVMADFASLNTQCPCLAAMNPVCLCGALFAGVGFGSTAQAPMTTALGLSFDRRLATKPSLIV
jgi:hypothetical protein